MIERTRSGRGWHLHLKIEVFCHQAPFASPLAIQRTLSKGKGVPGGSPPGNPSPVIVRTRSGRGWHPHLKVEVFCHQALFTVPPAIERTLSNGKRGSGGLSPRKPKNSVCTYQLWSRVAPNPNFEVFCHQVPLGETRGS